MVILSSFRNITEKYASNRKVFIASEGAHPPQTPPFQTRMICKVLLIIYKQYFFMFQTITQKNAGPTKI